MIIKSHKSSLSLLFFIIIFTGCLDNNSAGYDDTQDQAYLEEYAQKDGVMTTTSGLLYRVIEEGEGESPASDQYTIVKYHGESVDQSYTFDTGDSFHMIIPKDFVNFLGIGEGVQLMKEGGEFEFVLPTNLATYDGRVYTFQVQLESFLRKNQEQFLVDNAALEDVEVTSSGLQYRIIEAGDGEKPGLSNTVRIHYTGSFTSGYIFDQTLDDETAELVVENLISGLEEGLQLMNEGGKYEFFVPPELGYGNNPPQYGTVMIFEVELVEIL